MLKGVWLLSWRHLLHNRVQTAVLVLCIAVPIFLPVTAAILIADYRAALTSRAEATPWVAGMKGNRFDLTLAALYFRQTELPAIPYAEVGALHATGKATAIPMHVRFTAQGQPVVGTSPEYFRLRRLRAAAGTLPLQLGDCALGAGVAAALGLGPGDKLFSDPREIYDIAKPPALRMSVCGVLAPTGTADDAAVFVDVKTAWILEGIAHGHDDVQKIDRSLVLGEAEGRVSVSGALIEYNEVTPDNIDSFHYHGDPAALPLTAVIVVPADRKWGTILSERMARTQDRQMLAPSAVIADLMDFVFRIKALFDAFSAVLAACTAAMTALVLFLSARLRQPEMATLDRIGCSRGTVARLYAIELGLTVALSATLAFACVGLTRALLPDLIRTF